MKFLIFLTLIAAVFAKRLQLYVDDYLDEFMKFQKDYGKSYSDTEFGFRFKNFVDTLESNRRLSQLNPRATFGINKFSDLSQEEFAQQYLMNFSASGIDRNDPAHQKPHQRVENVRQCSPDPTNFDWNSCGAITPVYQQGQCGSCWAFSATETIESYYYLSGPDLTQLSMQQIVSCDQGANGCDGGNTGLAYEYVMNAGGIESFNDYPYTSETGDSGTCEFNSSDVVATIGNWWFVQGEAGIYQQASASTGGPVSICVDASTWKSYTGGVLTSCPTTIDHCVQLTGYANYGSSGAYWIVRNSWSANWGINGYIWLEIGSNICAMGNHATAVGSVGY